MITKILPVQVHEKGVNLKNYLYKDAEICRFTKESI